MSVLNKEPYLNQLLSTLTDEQKTTLSSLINGSSSFVFRSLVDANNLLTESDNLTAVALQLDNNLPTINGWFVNGAFLHFFSKSDKLEVIKINLESSTYEQVDEGYTATDLRQILGGISEGQVKEIIVDDKNILSQLEFDYDEDRDLTIITFPENVLPLTYYNSELEVQFTFDYESSSVYDDNGDVYEGGTITFRRGSVILVLEGVAISEGSSSDVITYCFFNNEEYSLNTRNLYFPVTGGAKVYQHRLRLKWWSNNKYGNAVVYSTSSTPLTITTWAKMLYDAGFTSIAISYPVRLTIESGNNSVLFLEGSVYSPSGTSITVAYNQANFTTDGSSVSVTVSQSFSNLSDIPVAVCIEV